jgi:hypothetical protein
LQNTTIGAEDLADISSYQTQKLEKILSDHEARFISWRICATSGKAVKWVKPNEKTQQPAGN